MTAWSGENDFAAIPVATDRFVLLKDSILASAVGNDLKGTLPVVLYALSIPSAFWKPAISMSICILVAVTLLIPDKRIEKKLFRGAF